MDILRDAEVIDNNDSTKKGYIKVRIYPEFIDMDESVLPWIQPYFNGTGVSDEHGTHMIPEIGDRVKVIVQDKYWKVIKYLTGEYIEGKYIYQKWSDIESKVTNNSGFSYPQPTTFIHYPDGGAYYHNSDTGETGIVTSDGSYININGDGKITIKGKSDIEIDADGEATVTGNNITIEGKTTSKITIKNGVEGADLKSILTDIQGILLNLVTPLNINSPMGPCVYTQVGTDLPKATLLSTKINSLLDS